jgi:hypothetical protein
MIDSGATSTFVSMAIAKELNLTITPVGGRIHFAFTESRPRMGIVKGVKLTLGTTTAIINAEVLDTNTEMILGLDLFKTFCLAVTNLPSMPPVESTDWLDIDESNPFLVDPAEFNPFDVPEWDAALRANQALPTNAVTNLPGAEITLDTGTHAPIYTRQYPIPYSRRESYQDFVTVNVEKDILQQAPVHNRWNTSMIAVPKKSVTAPSWLSSKKDDALKKNQTSLVRRLQTFKCYIGR